MVNGIVRKHASAKRSTMENDGNLPWYVCASTQRQIGPACPAVCAPANGPQKKTSRARSLGTSHVPSPTSSARLLASCESVTDGRPSGARKDVKYTHREPWKRAQQPPGSLHQRGRQANRSGRQISASPRKTCVQTLCCSKLMSCTEAMRMASTQGGWRTPSTSLQRVLNSGLVENACFITTAVFVLSSETHTHTPSRDQIGFLSSSAPGGLEMEHWNCS